MGPVTVIERPQPPSAQPPSIPNASAPSTAAPNPGAARRRLLLEGPIVSTLLQLAVPNVVVNVVLIAVTVSIDAHFVGQLDPSALAGLSLVFPLLMLMQQVANASMGGAVASAVSGWVLVHTTEAGLVGLAFVTAAGLVAYGAVLAIAFRAGAWRSATAARNSVGSGGGLVELVARRVQ